MHRVRVQPVGVEFDALHDEVLMVAAQAAGFYWPTVCGGKGTCRTCFAVVTAGGESLSPIEPWEAEGVAALCLPPRREPAVRLACQARVRGPVEVRKPGVRFKLTD